MPWFILQQVKYPQAKYSKVQINFICRKPAPFCPAGHGTSVWPELLLLMPDFKYDPSSGRPPKRLCKQQRLAVVLIGQHKFQCCPWQKGRRQIYNTAQLKKAVLKSLKFYIVTCLHHY